MQMRLHNRGISVLGARNSCRTSWPKYLLPLWPTYWATATPAPSTTHNWRLSPGRATSLSGRELVVNERNCLHTNGFPSIAGRETSTNVKHLSADWRGRISALDAEPADSQARVLAKPRPGQPESLDWAARACASSGGA